MVINVCERPWRHCWSCCGVVTSGSQAWRPPLHSCAAWARLQARCSQPSLICEGGGKPAPAPASRAPWAPTSVCVAAVPWGWGAGEGVSRGAGPAAPRHQALAPGAGSRPPMVCCVGRTILGVEFFQITYSSGLNSVPLKLMLAQNFRMQPYLEMTSLQVSPS